MNSNSHIICSYRKKIQDGRQLYTENTCFLTVFFQKKIVVSA